MYSIKELIKKLMGYDKIVEENELKNLIDEFKNSKTYSEMIKGEMYYRGEHDILNKKRTAIGVNGELEEVKNLVNNKIVDNQYRKMVVQKANYLLGKPITIQHDDKEYSDKVKKVINSKFQRLMKRVAEDCLNAGIGYVYVYYDSVGTLNFKRFKPYEVVPVFADEDRTTLEKAIRFVEDDKVMTIEVYDKTGVTMYTNKDGKIKLKEEHKPYISLNGKGFSWGKVPIIPFKYNSIEIPLIRFVKSLQDGINEILSTFANNMQEDARSSIMVLVNYDGTNIGEFRKNLSTYGVVKVRSDGYGSGDVKSLQVEVNSDNYKAILELFKKAIIENAMGYDAKDDRLSGNANQLNIQSMYNDIDLDANAMETEWQASFLDLMYFVNSYLSYSVDEHINFIFNRDMLMNESDIIENCQKSIGLLSTETIIAMHPWTDDVATEIERIKKEKKGDIESYSNGFGGSDEQ